jgi:succinate-semialdehyde dehydrogenase/glutarate-semialdehyde dehydrogenase
MKNKLKRPDLWVENLHGDYSLAKSSYAVFNPATGESIAQVPCDGFDETVAAIAVADKAYLKWKKELAKTRSQLIKKWHDLIVQNVDDLAIIITAEQGKPLAEARGEVLYAASFVEWFSEEAKRAYGDVIPSHKLGAKIIITKEPVGVVGAITPWNFPMAMLTRKLAPALAAGCTVVLKPSEETPLSAHALIALAREAGIPEGVLQCVSGNPVQIGSALMASKVVRKISFTGSTRTGKLLAEQAAGTVKKLSLELGGNAPFIVFEDADIDAAVAGAIASKYRNSGQTCVSVNRFFVHDAVYDDFSLKLAQAVGELKQGDGFDDGVVQGPLINSAAIKKVSEHVSQAVSLGAKILVGGGIANLGKLFYQPTVLADANFDMAMAHEETFGPVAALYRFKNDEEVIAMANNTEFGLAAYFYSNNLSRVWRIADALEVGMVGINEGAISSEVAPFGGIKESGSGREGSKYGLADYMETKYLLMGGLHID